MGAVVIGGPTAAPPPSFVPCSELPAGLTLQQTYTTSTTGLTWPVEWVYVVAVGGGGAGGNGTDPTGGGGGACVQGWLRSSVLTEVTIGAGGAAPGAGLRNPGGTTIVGAPTARGHIRAFGGGAGDTGVLGPYRGRPQGPGAGWGGVNYRGTDGTNSLPSMLLLGGGYTAHGLFAGGFGGTAGGVAGVLQSGNGGSGTSGGGASNPGVGGPGHCGPGGGGAGLGGDGGPSRRPDGTSANGGSTLSSGGGGGAGILAAGTGSTNNVGAAGGSGGGGGGGGAGGGGAGGNGAVLVYY